MIIILIIIGIGLFFGLAILLAGGIVWSQSSAKKEAKKILALGKIENHKKFEQISNLYRPLSTRGLGKGGVG